MRKATLIGVALLAALALSVGALAYPVVVGTHPLAATHAGSPATVAHPRNGDNSTDNETNDNETGEPQVPPAANETENDTAENETSDHQVAPFGNETDNDTEAQDNETAPVAPMPSFNESEMGNISVEHNVTAVHVDNTTYVNGTIVVTQNGTTLVDISFALVIYDNGTANLTFSRTTPSGSSTITVKGFAVLDRYDGSVFIAGTATATQNGTVLWMRAFGFELPTSGMTYH